MQATVDLAAMIARAYDGDPDANAELAGLADDGPMSVRILFQAAAVEAIDADSATFDFEESKHPRDHGRFADAEGAGEQAQLLAAYQKGAPPLQKAMNTTGHRLLGLPDRNGKVVASAMERRKAEVAHDLAANMKSSTADLLGSAYPKEAERILSVLGDPELEYAMYRGGEMAPGYAAVGGAPSSMDTIRADSPDAEQFLREAAAASLVSEWAGTSNDTSVRSLAMQEAAVKEFGLKDTQGWKTTAAAGRKVDAELGQHGTVYRDFLRAQYDGTQKLLKDKGISELTVARGFAWEKTKDVPQWALGDSAHVEGIQTRPMSSWSTNDKTAREFATDGHGAVVYETVPASRILSCPLTGNGCLNEREFVLLGGRESVVVGTNALTADRKLTASGAPTYDDDTRNEDWIKTLTWDLPTDPAAFKPGELAKLAQLPAGEAMPPALRAVLTAAGAARMFRAFVADSDAFTYDPDEPRGPDGRWGDGEGGTPKDGGGTIHLGPEDIALKGTPDGAGTPTDPIYVGKNLDQAVTLLAQGKSIRLDDTKQVSTLVSKLGAYSKELRDKGEKAPDFNLCLSGDTEVITWDGVKPISSLVGQARLLTRRQLKHGPGRWIDAEVCSFGHQRLWRVELTRKGRQKVVFATAEHRWFVRPTRTTDTEIEIQTQDLRPKMVLPGVYPRQFVTKSKSERTGTRPSPFGVMHGIVFGDGCAPTNSGHGDQPAFVVLYGDKDAQLAKWFPPMTHSSVHVEPGQYGYNVQGIKLSEVPRYFKQSPLETGDQSLSYLFGWLAGYFAADGTVTKKGAPILSSANRAHLEVAQTIANRLGFRTFGISGHERLGKGKTPTTLYSMAFQTGSLPSEFFLIDEHRRRADVPIHADCRSWTVVDVQPTERVEEVFCAVVPETGCFVLADNLLTGNCKVSVGDSNLFCHDTKNVPRAEMPQLSGVAIDGSPAAGLRKDPGNSDESVSIQASYERALRDSGVTITDRTVPAEMLRATQNEINGGKTGAILNGMLAGKQTAGGNTIYTSRDGYVLDGHHRWAATIAKDHLEGGNGNAPIQVHEVNMDIGAALDFTREFAKKMGVKQAGVSQFAAIRRWAAIIDAWRATFAWEESMHPRGPDGRFGEGDGGANPAGTYAFARSAVAEATKHDETTTDVLVGFAAASGGTMVGLDFRVKTVKSTERKIVTDLAEKDHGLDEEHAADEIHDNLRYTTTFEATDYSAGVTKMVADMKAQGFTVIKEKNTWPPGNVYRGLNMTVRNPAGYDFEMQFHTPNSFDTKEHKQHAMYEAVRDLPKADPARISGENWMRDIASEIPTPLHLDRLKLAAAIARWAAIIDTWFYNPEQARAPDGRWEDGGGGHGGDAGTVLLSPPLPPTTSPDLRQKVLERMMHNYGRDGQHFDTESIYDTIVGQASRWTAERQLQHDVLLEGVFQKAIDGGAQKGNEAVMLGGLPGAGKSTAIGTDLDESRYIVINPDLMKEELINRGMVPEISGVNPMELATLFHEESSALAKMLAQRAIDQGYNVIFDNAMGKTKGLDENLTKLEGAGYKVRGIFVDVPVDVSLAATKQRYTDFLNGNPEKGFPPNPRMARFVPEEVITKQADPTGQFQSKNRGVYDGQKSRFTLGWRTYSRTLTSKMRLVESSPPIVS